MKIKNRHRRQLAYILCLCFVVQILIQFNFALAETEVVNSVNFVNADGTLKKFAGTCDPVTEGTGIDQKDYYAFSELKLEVNSETENSFGLKVDFKLNDEYIAYYASEGTLEIEIKFGCSIVVPAGVMVDQNTDFFIVGKPNDPIGSYSLKNSATPNTLDLECVITIATDLNTVGAGASISCSSSNTISSDSKPQISYNETVYIGTVDFIAPTPTVTPIPQLAYKLEKTVLEDGQASFPYITYQILATVTNGTLDGTKIADTLPDGLELVEVSVDSTSIPITDTTKFEYTYPDDGSNLTSSTITIKASLTEAEIKSYLGTSDSSKYSKKFSNKAELTYNLNGVDKKVSSNTTETTIERFFLSKEGKASGYNGRRINWTVELNNQGVTSEQNVFFIDRINSDKHKYDLNSFQIAGTGITAPTELTGIDTSDSSNHYENLTAEKIKTLMTGSGKTGGFYYSYLDQTILILPVTSLSSTGKTAIAYQTLIPDTVTGSSASLKNNARIVWTDLVYGTPGIGVPNSGSIDLNKGYEAKFEVLKKSGVSYDPKTQIAVWEFAVNSYGAAMQQVLITDEINTNQQILKVPNGENLTVNSYDLSGGTIGSPKTITYQSGGGVPGENCYTITEEMATTTLRVNFQPVQVSDYYKFQIKTKVIDPELLLTQGMLVIF